MIYYVEDDQEIQSLILYTLKASGFNALGFSSGASFFKAMEDEAPDLIMLDIMLPDIDGLSILKRIKSNPSYRDIPIIMCTAKGSEYDKVIGLETGADDYLVKPFGMMEMVARIKALLRRFNNSSQEVTMVESGHIFMDFDKHIVKVMDCPLQLTLKEFDLLKLFLTNLNHVFSRDSLLEAVWGMDYVGESRTIDVHIGTLRTKLGIDGERIETVRGIGYKMVSENEKKNI